MSGRSEKKEQAHTVKKIYPYSLHALDGDGRVKSCTVGIAMLGDERESVMAELTPRCMEVVKNAAEIMRKKVRYADGSSPKVVTASKIVTSIRTSKEMGEELARENAKIIVMLYYIWDFPYLAWPFINTVGKDKPILSLSNNEGMYPGNVGLLATDGALRQTGMRTHRIVGDLDSPDVQAKVADWIRAAEAYTSVRGQVYGMYGGHSMGMETGYFHLAPIQKIFGVTTYQIDQLLLVERMKELDDEEVGKGFKWLSEMLGERIKYDGKMLTPETLKTQIRLYLAMNKVNNEWGFDFCGIKGQRELTEHVCITDVAEMLTNDPYDWNGAKEPFVCSTEADSLAALTMQILKYISGGLPPLFADVRLYHSDKDIWDFCNSGNHPSWYAARSNNPRENFKKITLHPALEMYFKAGGASVEFDAAPGEMTFARLGLWYEKFYMAIVKGTVLDLPQEERKRINSQTSPTWPHLHVRLPCNFEEFIDLFPCNHILAVPGDHINELVYLCEIAGVKPVILGEDAKKRQKPIWERVT